MNENDTPAARRWKPSHNRWAIAVVVTFAAFMEILDTTIVNVALPHIAGGLSTSFDEATWTLTSYLGRQWHRPDDFGLAQHGVRPQALLSDLPWHVHGLLVFLRHRDEPVATRHLPARAGFFRRRTCSRPSKRSFSTRFRRNNAPRHSASPRSQRLSRRCLGRHWGDI